MADSKISGLPTTTSLGGDELVPIVDDPSTSPTNKAVSVANLLAAGSATYQPLDGDLTTIAALDSTTAGALVTDGAGWIRKTYAQLKTALGLVKADVGLGNVDNTADASKPVSTAQQTALDLKANLASPALTGNPTAPTQTAGDNSTKLATTAYADLKARLLSEAHADASALNTVAETTLAQFAIPTTVKAGDVLLFEASGDLLNNSGGSVTYTPIIKVGTTAALTGAATGIGASASRRKWTMRVIVMIESTSAQRVSGRLGVSASSGSSWQAFSFGFEGSGVAAEDTTSAKNLTFTITLGTAASTIDFVMKAASLVHFPK